MKKILVILLTGSLLFANSAFAGRFGGGRSSGMQRSASPSSSANYGRSSQQTTGSSSMGGGQPQQQRSGMGAGSAAMLGAAVGAAGGYMLGKSNSNNGNVTNASGGVAAKASEEAKSSIPWGTIAILVAILALGLMFFRKKINPGLSSGNPMNNFTSNSSSNFNMPNINRTSNNVQANKPTKPILRFGSAAPAPEQIDKLPDGVETIYFLRQAKGMFLHIQSMNSSDNVSEIQKYMTAQLFDETKDDILKNQTLADFTNLDCQLMQCEAIPASQTEDGQSVEAHLVASVKFFGNVSDNPEQPPVPFSEIWNFVKSESTNNKWIVAGIQQEAVKS